MKNAAHFGAPRCARALLACAWLAATGCNSAHTALGADAAGAGSGDADATQTLAGALTLGAKFENGSVTRGGIPTATASGVTLNQHDPPFGVAPGGSPLLSLDVQNPDEDSDPVVATLFQFDGASDHVEVDVRDQAGDGRGGTYRHIETSFTLQGGTCRALCNKVFRIAMIQAVRLEDGKVSRSIAREFDLDCRNDGDERRCDEGTSSNDGGQSANPDDSGISGSGGAGGSGGSLSGSDDVDGDVTGSRDADACGTTLAVNLDCPAVAPIDGPCAPAGQCCQRASNLAKEAALGPNDHLVLEYRLQFSDTLNQPLTTGVDALRTLATQYYEVEQQSILWRFELPRKDGKLVAGRGRFTNGVGKYNCDGTYSYYSDTAAPELISFSTDKARWKPVTVEIDFDPNENVLDQVHIAFADNKNREYAYTPFVAADTYALNWELITQGFDLKSIDLNDAGHDCLGSRVGSLWNTGGTYWVYTPLKVNDVEPRPELQSQTYCQLAAFGAFIKTFSCATTERCAPYTRPPKGATDEQIAAGCNWKKLPDALCPETEEDRALFGCHLGDRLNINAEADYPSAADLKCTQDAPTTPQDPETGSAGQCCDPLGNSTTLPACNAYRLIQSYVAAAAAITSEPSNQLQSKCM